MRTVVFGQGWIGRALAGRFGAELSGADILDQEAVAVDLKQAGAEVAVNAAGKTGRPNVDWCEASRANRRLTYRSNSLGPACLEETCRSCGARLVHLSSGCLWESGESIPEDHPPRPNSFYAATKAWGEEKLRDPSTLVLRMRMVFCKDFQEPRNLIRKLAGYPVVLDEQNSMTFLDDFLDAAWFLAGKGLSGTYHVVNRGTASGADVMRMYREIVDPSKEFRVSGMAELLAEGRLKAGRSNVSLSGEKLEAAGFRMPDVRDRLEECMRAIAYQRSA